MVIFDPAKDAANIEKHGVSLAQAEEVDLEDALVIQSDRDGEKRFVAYGLIAETLFALIFVLQGDDVRAISLRPASRKERKVYTVWAAQAV